MIMLNLKNTPMPLLIKNYADAFGIKVRMQGTSAYTNGKTITIPRMDITDPLKGRLAYGYLAHESAHVKYTDFAYLKKFLNGSEEIFLKKELLNILEDHRIETLISHDFIGVYENLQLLLESQKEDLKTLLEPNELKKAPLLYLILNFIHFYGYAKCQKFDFARSYAVVFFHEIKSRHFKYLNQIAKLTASTAQAKSTKDVGSIVKKILDYIYDFDFGKDNQKLHLKTLSSEQNLVQKLEESSEFDCKSDPKQKELVKQLARMINLASRNLGNRATVVKTGEQIMEENGEGQSSSSRDDFGLFVDARPTQGRDDFIKFANQNFALRSLIRTKVNAYVDFFNGGSYQGRKLNIYKAQNINMGEYRIFDKKTVNEGFSTSVQILVDVSSSMLTKDDLEQTRAHEANVCALNIALALEGIDGIENAVHYFPGDCTEYETALKFGERASKFAPFFDQKPRGSTPLAQCLYKALEDLKKVNCNRNMIFIITDGMPDSVTNVLTAMNALEQNGVEVYGISICSELISKLFEKHPENVTVLKDASELNRAFTELFKKQFAFQNVA